MKASEIGTLWYMRFFLALEVVSAVAMYKLFTPLTAFMVLLMYRAFAGMREDRLIQDCEELAKTVTLLAGQLSKIIDAARQVLKDEDSE